MSTAVRGDEVLLVASPTPTPSSSPGAISIGPPVSSASVHVSLPTWLHPLHPHPLSFTHQDSPQVPPCVLCSTIHSPPSGPHGLWKTQVWSKHCLQKNLWELSHTAGGGESKNRHLRKWLVRMHYSLTYIQTTPDRTAGFFSFTTPQQRYTLHRNPTLTFELCSFPRLVICV